MKKGTSESRKNRLLNFAYLLGFLEGKVILLKEFEASNFLEALIFRNKFMDWGEYSPSRLENGEIDPSYFEE